MPTPIAERTIAGPTRGPWVSAGSFPHGIYGPDGSAVAYVGYPTTKPHEEADANARLITAAPDLLTAAKEAYEFFPGHAVDCEGTDVAEDDDLFENREGCTCIVGRLEAAIRKAEPR